MTDAAAWLRGLGRVQHEAGQHEAAFRDGGGGAPVLPEPTAEDLEIGVAVVGHRRKPLAAIAALRGPPRSPAAAAEPRPAPTPPGDAGAGHGAERRQLTVLFCDLAGSPAPSARLDPEDMREVVAVCHRAAAEVVERHGGYVARSSATACSPASAGPRRTKTTPSARWAPARPRARPWRAR